MQASIDENLAREVKNAPMLFGAPFELNNRARYRHWPSVKEQMPLHYFCACMILAGTKRATATNERVHSPASRINSKLRSRLKPSTVERLTLAYFMLRAMAAGELPRPPPSPPTHTHLACPWAQTPQCTCAGRCARG